ncbi:MAG: hypothetical protein NTZ55_02160, partial [Candidatus Roizmanbacteria bacterium]|nr:hypothetical protein [Candidatus Roizmanbacteria bacterium]
MPPITNEPTDIPSPIACTLEAKTCPDGSVVGRVGPNCEFEKCPDTTEVSKIFTGTITAINYGCHVDGECSVQIGKGNVILESGESLNKKGVWGNFPADVLNEKNVSKYIGREVEVYAASVGGR